LIFLAITFVKRRIAYIDGDAWTVNYLGGKSMRDDLDVRVFFRESIDTEIMIAMPMTDDDVRYRFVSERTDFLDDLFGHCRSTAAVVDDNADIANDERRIAHHGVARTIGPHANPNVVGDFLEIKSEDLIIGDRCGAQENTCDQDSYSFHYGPSPNA
jgi:hypothetical protein